MFADMKAQAIDKYAAILQKNIDESNSIQKNIRNSKGAT